MQFPDIEIPDGEPEYLRSQMAIIDRRVSALARKLIEDSPPASVFRDRADEYDARRLFLLADINRQMADDLDLDARLHVAGELWARSKFGAQQFFYSKYLDLVRAAALTAKAKVAAMQTEAA